MNLTAHLWTISSTLTSFLVCLQAAINSSQATITKRLLLRLLWWYVVCVQTCAYMHRHVGRETIRPWCWKYTFQTQVGAALTGSGVFPLWGALIVWTLHGNEERTFPPSLSSLFCGSETTFWQHSCDKILRYAGWFCCPSCCEDLLNHRSQSILPCLR